MRKINYYNGNKTIKIEVTDEVAKAYQEIKREEWRQEKRKLRKENVSFEEISELGMQFEDENSNIEENFFRNDELLHREKLLTYLPALVQSLKLEQQELIKMYFYDGLSYSDIGQALGITKQSAFEKMRTILKKLKKLL